jgi:hypothetical protein
MGGPYFGYLGNTQVNISLTDIYRVSEAKGKFRFKVFRREEFSMAYNRNNNGNTSYSKPAEKAASTAPTTRTDADGEKVMPVGSLHVQGKSDEKKQKITGLFKRTSKNGLVYYSGSDKDGNRFLVYLD